MNEGIDKQPTDGELAEAAAPKKRPRRRPIVRVGIILFDIVVVLGIALFLAGVMLAGKDIPAPVWVAQQVGDRLSTGLGGGSVDVGSVTVRVENDALPQVTFHDVAIVSPKGRDLLSVPALDIKFDKSSLWEGQVRPKRMEVSGASLSLRRGTDGRLDLGFGEGAAQSQLGSIEEAFDAVRQAFDLPGLSEVERIEIAPLNVRFEDERAARVWQIEDGSLIVNKNDGDLSIALTLLLPRDGEAADDPSTIALRLSLAADGGAELSALVKDVPAADIAALAPALSWLQPVQAEVSGAIIAGMTSGGSMGGLNGTLEVTAGVLKPEGAARAIPFNGARAYFTYHPEDGRISFEEFSLSSPEGSFSATGHTLLEGMEAGWPTAMVGQLRISDARLDPPGLLPEPASFDGGILEFKAALEPFALRIGQLVLTTDSTPEVNGAGASRLEANGHVTADAVGWHVSLDVAIDQIETAPLFAHWPPEIAPGTRGWIEGHMQSGLLRNVQAALRLNDGERPDLGLTFEFEDVSVQPIRSLPPITNANGFASMGRDVFSLSLDTGTIDPPLGGAIDVGGSVFHVADTRQSPAVATIYWQSESSITSGLSLLDEEPFGFITGAGQPVELAKGRADLSGEITFPLRRLTGSDVSFDFAGNLWDVGSDVVVPGRSLDAETLALSATNKQISIAGAGRLEAVPVDAVFTLPLGEGAAAPSVEGTVQIGRSFVDNFGIGLPDGMISGAGPGRFRVDLPRAAAPTFNLESGTSGIGISVPELDWSKSAGAAGQLKVSGRLGDVPSVDTLYLEAPGLTAQGAVTLNADGSMDTALFSRLAVGRWLDAPVRLKGRGSGRSPSIFVEGGRIDIRRTSMAGGSGSSSDGDGPPMSLALNRLVITEGLELTQFRGEMVQSGGMTGTFSGLVNGQARVTGTVEPGRNGGTAVRIRSTNAGAAFKAAKVFRQANGGSMTLVLQPRSEAGQYDGTLDVENVRVRSSTGLAALMNAISVVGLLDELNGSGIVFSEVEARFRLTPTFVQVTSASGVGPSLGISMEGVYDLVSDRLDMQGVFSPIYMVNALGSLFTRKGEGLFGVTYRMRGDADNPSVEVNPLSALTPGMFREIFRAPPPKVRSGG